APSVELIAPEASGDYADAPSEGVDGVFIDPTDYSLGATASPSGPAVIFSDRSTGCQLTVGQGQSIPNQVCASAPDVAGQNLEQAGEGSGGGGLSIGPVTIGGNGITVGGTTVVSREYFNESIRPLNLLRRGAEEFVFPLATPAPITSLFGWRTHPIFGDRRFHSGTDLGAPTGTPVLAAKDGEVSVADYLGGYGNTVILRHEDGTQETRYAHLSQILVNTGEKVKQGEVVGLVGSTGNSTGPHLHFELRELTAQGWVLIDPDELMQHTVASLVGVLNNPLHALGLAGEEAETEKSDLKNLELPYRPAQPNAS
ncbi:MAG: M23 family metallopeptidase, partial [Cyanobacteria bacterium J06636_16]